MYQEKRKIGKGRDFISELALKESGVVVRQVIQALPQVPCAGVHTLRHRRSVTARPAMVDHKA